MDSLNEKCGGTTTVKTGAGDNEGRGDEAAKVKLQSQASFTSSEDETSADEKGSDAGAARAALVGLESQPASPVGPKKATAEAMELEVAAPAALSVGRIVDGEGEVDKEGNSFGPLEESEESTAIVSVEMLADLPEKPQPRKRKECTAPTGSKRSRTEGGKPGEEAALAPSGTPPPPPQMPPPPPQPVTTGSKRAPVKPVQNWKKVIRLPASLEDRLASDQVFRALMPTYVPCVPKGTSQRLVEHLTRATPTDLEQLCCPGCKDRFLLASSFFQHVYRKSVKLTFACSACDGETLTFFNRCHLRTHVVGHMENDGVSAVAADRFDAAPLDTEQFDSGFFDDDFTRLVRDQEKKRCLELFSPLTTYFEFAVNWTFHIRRL